MRWTAAIIAGGAASRLDGRDKSALQIGGQSILDRQLAAIRPLTDLIVVVTSNGAPFSRADLDVVADLVPGAAALGGIYTALSVARTDHVVALACDMPFVTTSFLDFLVRAGRDFDLAIPRTRDGYQGMAACYSRGCIEPIRERIGRRSLKIQELASAVRTREISPEELDPFGPDALFFNVNTPDDYMRAEKLASGQASTDPITR